MFTKNASADVTDVCTTNIQYRAEIIFKLATNNIQVTVTSRRLSFFDKLSAFGKKLTYIFEVWNEVLTLILLHITGGILGLFTGMSILSMVEIAWWLLRCMWYPLRLSGSLKRWINKIFLSKVDIRYMFICSVTCFLSLSVNKTFKQFWI